MLFRRLAIIGLSLFSFIFGTVGADAAVSQKRVVRKIAKKPATRKVIATKKKPIRGRISKKLTVRQSTKKQVVRTKGNKVTSKSVTAKTVTAKKPISHTAKKSVGVLVQQPVIRAAIPVRSVAKQTRVNSRKPTNVAKHINAKPMPPVSVEPTIPLTTKKSATRAIAKKPIVKAANTKQLKVGAAISTKQEEELFKVWKSLQKKAENEDENELLSVMQDVPDDKMKIEIKSLMGNRSKILFDLFDNQAITVLTASYIYAKDTKPYSTKIAKKMKTEMGFSLKAGKTFADEMKVLTLKHAKEIKKHQRKAQGRKIGLKELLDDFDDE